ncbi:carbohydrate ABC transporter permease [Paenibacillus eucommiae]|uniref:Aldouronate transport system permease protein n=1 Tax=Paenibacillus eucommiae TaxID=1355755 RepID=A0ABS4IMI9_9BACL|nr:carbohydrate ABC transporter permease [Paenibacillus eucommiae]MBP1988793.1 putative aldouronate transport system permease protein [Paenibacillus eucommiae]
MSTIRKRTGEKVFDVLLYLLLLLIMFITLYPFWNQVALSISDDVSAYSTGMLLFPSKISLDSYGLVLQYKLLWIGYGNTILRTILGVSLSIVFTSLTAYPLSKEGLPWNKLFTTFILITMLFNGGLIPNYFLIKNLGLYDTIWALVLPGMIGAFNVFIMRNFFRSIPESLEESAKMDGAGYILIFWKIVIPLSKPVLATVAMWVAVYHWNAWFDSMIYISDTSKQVLQVVLRKIIVENNVEDLNAVLYQMGEKSRFSGRQLQATMIMCSLIPMLIVYPFVQRHFVKGIMLGAIKG